MLPTQRQAATLLALALALTSAPAAAQTRSINEVQLNDLRTMKDKVVALANAFPESAFAWRPMEGTRSFREVLPMSPRRGIPRPQCSAAPCRQDR